MSEQPPPIVGIDLGTTNSLVCVMQAGQPVLIPNGAGELLTMSAVSVEDSGHVLVGPDARARLASHPEATAVTFKRDMGTGRARTLGRKSWRPEELSAAVLGALKADAEAFLGVPVEEAVITVPAYFGDLQRQATRAAARIAGLRADRIINEPTAAALAFGLHNLEHESTAVVLDLGGGTFDVTVLEIIEGVVEIQSTAGDAQLGGEDFSEALRDHVLGRLEADGVTRETLPETSLARLFEACERAKKRLSTSDEAAVVVPALARRGAEPLSVSINLRRDEVDRVFEPLLRRMRGPIQRALRDAQRAAEDIEEVLLVGGATRMPCIVSLSAELFGRAPRTDLPADHAVAMGAAIQAALKAGDASVEDLVVTDVAPFTLGISSVSTLGTRMVEGVFSPILERGTVIPASRVEQFFTVSERQTEIEVEVFQGEHANCADNTFLGKYKVTGIPADKAGQQGIDVRFTYDLNGVLEVETTVKATGTTKQLVIERNPGALSKAQVESAQRAMAKLKFHPRDTLPNRTALARADALFVELTGEQRQMFGHAISQFRAALETQDPNAIDDAREHLVALTARFKV